MSCTPSLVINPGRVLLQAFRWAESARTYRTVTAVSLSAPCLLTVPGHGLPDAWPFRLEGIKGPDLLNSDPEDPVSCYRAQVASADTLQLELSTLGQKPLVGQAALSYLKPVDLSGYSARFTLKTAARATTNLFQGPAAVDLANQRITVTLADEITQAFPSGRAWYALDVLDDQGNVYAVDAGEALVL